MLHLLFILYNNNGCLPHIWRGAPTQETTYSCDIPESPTERQEEVPIVMGGTRRGPPCQRLQDKHTVTMVSMRGEMKCQVTIVQM